MVSQVSSLNIIRDELILTFYFLMMIKNGRVAKLLTVGVRQLGDKRPSSFSRCCALVRYEASKISSDSFSIIKSLNTAGNHQAAW